MPNASLIFLLFIVAVVDGHHPSPARIRAGEAESEVSCLLWQSQGIVHAAPFGPIFLVTSHIIGYVDHEITY